MNRIALLTAICSCGLVTASALASAPSTITGDYVEIRSCDVYTGPCFANGEMGLTGEEAVLTWSVRQGTWEGIRLDGLNVLAVVKSKGTLGDVGRVPRPSKSVLIIDSNADAEQQEALVQFARQMAGGLLDDMVRVDVSPIQVMTNPSSCSKNGCSLVTAGDLVEIQTRCLGGDDHVCGNEDCYYPPLTKIDNARPAFTEVGLFQGKGLGITFNDTDRRSAYLGTFAR
ncbi:MAG: DUF1326 domain-containing protein [Planctomycetes bacterium]|nr:DUF1326 domain-containing protein [Planctomycetota bacterium]